METEDLLSTVTSSTGDVMIRWSLAKISIFRPRPIQAVFSTLSASARALTDAAAKGRSAPVEIVMTTQSGESAGFFEMTPAQAKLLVDRNLTVQDYFVKNVVF